MSETPRGTPRLASAFPDTPQYGNLRQRQARLRSSIAAAAATKPIRKPLSQSIASPADGDPVISLALADAATQRRLAILFWGVLWAWKFYDVWNLYTSNDPQSLWNWLKWISIDGMFLYGLPALRIPWLQWSATTMNMLFLSHAVINTMLMFQIGLPLAFWLERLIKLFWDTEMAISERRVKPTNLLDPSSLILGKQVIHILPEGTAILNPFDESFCVGIATKMVEIPIQINQTDPVQIDLLRRDFDMKTEETISIKTADLNKMKKAAIALSKRVKSAPAIPEIGQFLLRYPIKKPGQYTIRRIIDRSKLDVRPKPSEVLVVSCPSAKIKLDSSNRCRGDLSALSFEVEGVPPLKMKYRKLVNGNPSEASFQSIQPDNFMSPLRQELPLVKYGDTDLSWAASQPVTVPINEIMNILGQYSYIIDEVQDAFGNRMQYTPSDNEEEDLSRAKYPGTSKAVTVRDRPMIWIPRSAECNAERPLKVAKGRTAELPHRISSVGRTEKDIEWPNKNDYVFTGDHYIEFEYLPEGEDTKPKTLRVKKRDPADRITIKDPGLYILKSIRTDFCSGEVAEPSSCLLQNPPEPDLELSTSEISHKCANSPIGLLVDLDFEGTPPFTVQYVIQKGSQQQFKYEQFSGHRGQVRLEPHDAGRYEYAFIEVQDKYYKVPLNHVLTQDVRPSASATIVPVDSSKKDLCLGQSAAFQINLFGEAPWALEYELIHGKSRKKTTVKDITDPVYKVTVPDLKDGGEYTLSLSSVADKSGCKEFLKDQEQKFQVWSKLPTAAFGQLNGKHFAQILEGNTVRIPLKFTGQVLYDYRIKNRNTGQIIKDRSLHANGILEVKTPGTYVLEHVADGYCEGITDSTANTFEVEWISRPTVSILQHPTIDGDGAAITKQEVCEGEEDHLELAFQGKCRYFNIILTNSGAPPFDVKYEEHTKLDDGSKSLRKRELSAALGVATVPLDTSKAGTYQYKFLDIADANYDAHAKHRSSLMVSQRVNPRPSARFTNPGKIYSYCSADDNDDSAAGLIPITISGVAPFDLEVDIKYSGSVSPESITFNGIATNQHNLQIPRRYLRAGHSHLTIRRVRDSRGCQSRVDPNVQLSRIQISVHDPPDITPLESRTDFCVGDRLSFRLSGVTPFTVFYTFEGSTKKATASDATFKRLAERPGEFVITGVSDSSSKCKFSTHLEKIIHPLPSVKVSQGRETYVDIHEGGEAEILFEFTGTPPFEFTYTRSENAPRSGSGSNKRGVVLETKTERTEEHSIRIKASEEGTYEVISVRDKWCAVSKGGVGTNESGRGQKLLT
jgi:nucleoporin POM152